MSTLDLRLGPESDHSDRKRVFFSKKKGGSISIDDDILFLDSKPKLKRGNGVNG